MHDDQDGVGEQAERPQPIVFSRHAREQMAERGASEAEVIDTIRAGEEVPARGNRRGYRRNFQYDATGAGAGTRSNRYSPSSPQSRTP